MFVVYGTRVYTTFEKQRTARCGRCLAKTAQDVSTLERRGHLYFIEVTSDDLGRVAECTRCKTVIPVRSNPGANRKERWGFAFLDAHVLDLERADKSDWLILAVLGLGALFFGAMGLWFWLVGQLFEGDAIFFAGAAGVLALGLGSAWVYGGLRERVGDHVLARRIRITLGALQRRFDILPRELAGWAKERGYPRFSRHFSSVHYASAATDDSSPYRS